MITIRPAGPSDLATVGVLHARSRSAAYAGIVPATALAAVGGTELAMWWTERWRYERDTHRMLVAEDQATGELTGFAYLGPSPDPDVGELYAIHVDPEHQGQGVGQALMSTALSRLTDLGCSSAVLWVLVDNSTARHFYERGTWRCDGVERESPIGTTSARQVRYSRAAFA